MSLINVQNLTFAYDGSYENVFENVSFQLDTDWKTGLVGRNGRGKTTFLRLLTGEYEYSGKITSSVEFTYFPFDVMNKERLVLEILSDVCPNSEDKRSFARNLSLCRGLGNYPRIFLSSNRARRPILPVFESFERRTDESTHCRTFSKRQ